MKEANLRKVRRHIGLAQDEKTAMLATIDKLEQGCVSMKDKLKAGMALVFSYFGNEAFVSYVFLYASSIVK